MPHTRAVITGLGVVSPFGVGRDVFWNAVSAGVSGTRAITAFDASGLACRVAAAVPEEALDAEEHRRDATPDRGGGRDDPRRYAKVSRIAVLAAREALRDSGIDPATPDLGVIVGSGAGGIDVAERQYSAYFAGDWHKVSPYAIPVSIVGIVSSEISIALGLNGISHVLSTGCTSSTDAIGYAASLIRHGEADALVTGGADACVTPGMMLGFTRMRAVSTAFNDRPAEASRPFDRDRDGFVLGEGAWMMLLEREDRALARGAHIYAAVEGYGSTCDAYHRVQMDPEGTEIVRAMKLALCRAKRTVDSIGYVNFHGTSTMLNDAVEARCVRRLFGRAVRGMAGSSTKSMIGHPQGASGAAGVVTTALALSTGILPPTINVSNQDADCDLDVIANAPRRASLEAALCNCLGFGSKNSALVLARAGARVIVVDREPFPRDKLCGDTLNPGAVRLLASLGLTAGPLPGALPLRGMRVTGPRASVTGTYKPGAVGLAVRRRDLDTWLLHEAVAAGVRFESGLVARRPLVDGPNGGLVRGLVLSRPGGGAELRMPAMATIAADGRRSVLARAAGLRHDRSERRRWAFGTYAEGIDGMTDLGEMHIRAGWYLGLAPIGSGLTNVCVVTPPRPQGCTPLEIIRTAASSDQALAARFARARFVEPVRVLGPLAADVTAPGVPGMLLAGDAAGFIDPMTGDGLHLAMQSAMLAADETLRTLEQGDYRGAVRNLAASRHARLASKLRFDRYLRRLVDSPAAVDAASRGASFFPGLVRRAISYAGDVE